METRKPISPLRQRMIEDMRMRKFDEKTQCRFRNHAAAFRGFLPGGLFDVCPQALAHHPALSRGGQTSNKPKPQPGQVVDAFVLLRRA